jgi:hypothetical protein
MKKKNCTKDFRIEITLKITDKETLILTLKDVFYGYGFELAS